MNLAFSTLGCPSWSLASVLANAQHMGFQGVELRGIAGEMNLGKMPDLQPEAQGHTLDAVARHGLTLTNLGLSASFHDAAKLPAALKEGREGIDICGEMGIPAVRVFGDQITDLSHESITIEQVSAALRELCAYAHPAGVQVWLEVHGMFNTLERIQGVLERVPSEAFGILWDVQHTDKVYGDDFLSFYKPLRKHIRHVHLKDHHRQDGAFRLCPPGEGDIPLLAIARTLEADGYEGFLSFEWEKVWHPELPPAELVFPQFIELMRGA